MDPRTPRRVAVVGSGVAGLTAAYVASRTARVTLFEADDRLGGHADTHDVVEAGRTEPLAIDTGFIVHNPRTYPVLLRMFAELDVATQASDMSMSISDEGSGLEWAGAIGRAGLFPTGANLRNPRYLRMLTEIPLFHRRAKALLATPPATAGADTTLREFLEQTRFSAYFVRHFMEPVVAAVWSCDPEVSLDYPARYLFTFLEHHGMLGIFGSPQWRTVTGGSRSYVAKVAALLDDVRTGVKVTSVLETPDGVEVTDGNGETSTYDAVVIATHPGQALAMLADPTPLQRELLTAMPYSPNTALLHTDTSLMPDAPRAWASWNFRRPLSELASSGTQASRSRRLGGPPSLRGGTRAVSRPGNPLSELASSRTQASRSRRLGGPPSLRGGTRAVSRPGNPLSELASSGTQASRSRPADASAAPDPSAHTAGTTDQVDTGDGSTVLVTYDLTRLQRLDTDVHYLVTLGGEHLVDPATVIDRMEYEHPLYNPASVAAQARLPEIDTDRVAFAGAYHGWGFHEDGARSGLAAAERVGLTWPTSPVRPSTVPATPRVYDTTITHTRRTPIKRAFTLRSRFWLVDVDDLPDHGVLGRFEARDHLGDPDRSIRDNLDTFLATHDRALERGGRVLMAANARAFGYNFNPISVFWCFTRAGELEATVVEVHNTYGDRHAYLVAPDERGRAETDKAMYVSPFHGTDGTYELTVPVPAERLDVVVRLRTEDGARFDATMRGTPTAGMPTSTDVLRAAPAALRGSLLIRAHGVWLWLRRLPIRPRPTHHQEGVQ